ncbi:DUF7716 domain-containing protein [Serratia sp. 2723]|uniref:DUF7716 domain-containing protein n=1 Tax=unclassified Serratia (in: enterobacteria) TaxID=2647522 RepID=UPI003D250C6C
MQLVTIRDVLLHPKKNPEGWFYLPSEKQAWSLDTLGIFSLDSYDYPADSDEYIPKQAKEDGWIEILDNGAIEEVVDNAHEQLGKVSDDELFKAFVFYYENDAFIEF